MVEMFLVINIMIMQMFKMIMMMIEMFMIIFVNNIMINISFILHIITIGELIEMFREAFQKKSRKAADTFRRGGGRWGGLNPIP